VMREIMEGEATPAQLGAFLTALALKGETTQEIAGMARVMREMALRVEVDGELVAAAEEERFVRDKHAKNRMPYESAKFCLEQAGIKPKKYLNMNIEVITSSFKNNKLDAAVIWEPTAAKIQLAGIARRAATGESFEGIEGGDAGFLVMLWELIKDRPDVHKGWLEAELDAQLFMIDLNNSSAIAEMADDQTEGMSRKTLWASLYGTNPRPR